MNMYGLHLISQGKSSKFKGKIEVAVIIFAVFATASLFSITGWLQM